LRLEILIKVKIFAILKFSFFWICFEILGLNEGMEDEEMMKKRKKKMKEWKKKMKK
jgi:hypothetical protein